jgi:hypothetical protein
MGEEYPVTVTFDDGDEETHTLETVHPAAAQRAPPAPPAKQQDTFTRPLTPQVENHRAYHAISVSDHGAPRTRLLNA